MTMDDRNGMEEGEYRYYKDHGDGTDPEISLSYLDEKIRHVLGPFQKDFEGGVSVENLGPMSGGYGTFLLSSEHFPSTSPHMSDRQRDSKTAISRDNLPSGVSLQNQKAPPSGRPAASQGNATPSGNTKETWGNIYGKRDSCLPLSDVTNNYPLKDGTLRSPGNLKNKRSLKIRLKVPCEKRTGHKNAAIYRRLGLEDSPCSDISEGMLPVVQGAFQKSPAKIIQEMTSFPVPGGALMSPLHDSLLGLSRKEKASGEKERAVLINEKSKNEANPSEVKRKPVSNLIHDVSDLKPSCGASVVPMHSKDDQVKEELKKSDLKPISGQDCLKSSKQKTTDNKAFKQKLFHRAALHEKSKDSSKAAKCGIVGKNKLEGPQKAGGRAAGSFEEGFKVGTEALKRRKDVSSDTPESESKRKRLKLLNNEEAEKNSKSFNSSGLKIKSLDDSGTEKFKSKTKERLNGGKDIHLMTAASDRDGQGACPISEVEPPPADDDDIEENWVCCDRCQKWRLLPSEIKPEELPEKWLCSMLNWLPGMNRCGISEQETTEKLSALYELPVSDSAHVSQKHANGPKSVDTAANNCHLDQNLGKGKHSLKETQNPGSSIRQFQVESPLKKHQTSENRSRNDSSHRPSTQFIKGQAVNEKHNLAEGKNRHPKVKFVDEVSCKQLKRKNERPEENGLCLRAVKKCKTDDMCFVDDHRDFDADLGKLGHSSNSLSHLTKANSEVKRSTLESDSSSHLRASRHNQFGGEKGARQAKPIIPRKCTTKLTRKEKIHASDEGLVISHKLEDRDAADKRLADLPQSNKTVKLLNKQSQKFEAENKRCLQTEEMKDGKSKCSLSSGGDAPKSNCLPESKIENSGNAGNKNGVSHELQRPGQQGLSNIIASSLESIKSSSPIACNTLKEAKDLRDSADRFKSSGFSYESTEAYFQSALKFLHGAFLLETSDNASGKDADMTHMQFYGITAELFETCAHEYEKRQEMAAAALAYKCIEVACMRVVFSKHSTARKDGHEIHLSLRSTLKGESPSSSASDLDNLSNQATMGNGMNLAELLDFTRYIQSAMEASAKSQKSFVSAGVHVSEAQNRNYVASVKKAMDFSFQDVQEFIRLVRLAMDAITQVSGAFERR